MVNNRDKIADELIKRDVDVNMVHIRNDIYSVFGGKRQELKNMNFIEDRYIYLPINTYISDNDIKKIVSDFNEIVARNK